MSRSRFYALLLVGLLIRAAALPLPGTGDVEVWKAWSYNAVNRGVRTLYGVGHQTDAQMVLHWDGVAWTVDYPPVALYELDLAGHLYRLVDPEMANGPLFTVFVKLPSVAAEAALG